MKLKGKIFVWVAVLLVLSGGLAQAAGQGVSVAKAFYELARQNNTQKIESLLHRGYSLESVDECGYNPVCISVIRQDRNAYKTLSSCGANKQPSCLKKIPESAYRRFFGVYPAANTAAASSYMPDSPYLIGAAILGAGAVAAYAFRGSTDSGSGGGDTPTPGPDPDPENCPANSTYVSGKCVCNSGYGHFGDDSRCYAEVVNCKDQNKDACSSCDAGYILSDNICYAPINHCTSQTGDICNQCEAGYGTHGGDKKACWQDIDNCATQFEGICQQCDNGFGTHGDEWHCYKDIENCLNQTQDACKQCGPGYDTYGDPYKCYDKNPCAAYPNSVPAEGGTTCVCNADKGYTGDPYNGGCSQTSGGDYNEGDEKQEEWNNYNELYCNSHGKYDTTSKKCTCYAGYTDESCSSCAENYLNFGNVCFRDLLCSVERHLVQVNNSCVCDEQSGYTPYYNKEGNMQCMAKIACELHHEQTAPDTCSCKPNFDENCEECIAGFTYDAVSDRCVRTSFVCEGKWTGTNCDICPSQFKLSADGQSCGPECADNRAPYTEDETCGTCAAGYEWSNNDNTCITNECTTGQDGYIVVEDGHGNKICQCDTANGWGMSTLGKCERKAPDLIGIKDSNINNAALSLENNGEMRDVYGMKPVLSEDGEGNITYYDSVYNALASSGTSNASISITNSNTGGNRVYGIYSQSDIYNAAAINAGAENVTAAGTLKIDDINTSSDIYGIYAEGEGNNVYNGFVYANSPTATDNQSNASIIINKSETSSGNIIGIVGSGNIYNSYASTDNGIGANANVAGSIKIKHQGVGSIIGISNANSSAKIYNSLAYLNSAVSNAVSKGEIILSGNGSVYGISGSGAITNSETQFSKNYNIVQDFSSYGLIDVTTSSDVAAAYGMYTTGADNVKTALYNAKGYNSTGDIKVANNHGGSAYGMYSGAQTYTDPEDGVLYYNNTYNAFRSSAVYGNSVAQGNIEMVINGYSQLNQSVVGIFAAGNAFNAYANSGSGVKLETVGNIAITDNSETPNIKLRGIESSGATIANAYSMGQNANSATVVTGNINISVNNTKNGVSEISGIYSGKSNPQGTHIYNAALINDKNNVTGTVNLVSPNGALAPSKMYGIYATSYNTDEKASEAQPKYIYNAYYENSSDISEGNVSGIINVTAQNKSVAANGEYYGMYIVNGEAYNAYGTNSSANVSGSINVDVVGGANDGVAAGMYGENATLNNSGKGSSISVTSRGSAAAYGMKGENAYLYNDAKIDVTSAGGSDAYGMYVNKGAAVNDANGVMNINGNGKNYGIYAISDGTPSGKVQVVNNGKIFVMGGENVGIYAAGETATVSNNGLIVLDTTENYCTGADCNNGRAIILENGATYDNSGTTSATGSLDFDRIGGNVVLSKGGKFEAVGDISGSLKVSSNVVTDTFKTVSTVEGALSGEDVSGVSLSSKSYLYNAGMKENQDGKYDVVMEMKDFDEVTDSDAAAYYALNYENEKNAALFNALKKASTAAEYSQTDADIRGTSLIPNIAEENLKVQRSLDRTMISELFKDGGDIRRMVGADGLYIGRDDRGTLTGYDLNAQSMYALYDQKLNSRYRLGAGFSFTHTDTDYNDDSSRKSFMVQGYVPLTYANGRGLTAVSMARLGFADGDYQRRGADKTYKADTAEITYGWLNELRYKMDLGIVNLTPFVGLNAIGYYQNGMDEGDGELALDIDSSYIFSLESALGLYIDRDIEFNQDNKLSLALGIGYYHEFADPYRGMDARINDTFGGYKLRNRDQADSRDRGILSAKVNYDYKDFSVYGELMQYLEEEYPIKVDVGLKYRF